MKITEKHRQHNLAGIVLALTTGVVFYQPGAQAAAPVHVDQGKHWTATDRIQFYSQDQGSQIIPLSWINALQQPDGKPFMADSLSRYGYLPNPQSKVPGLPLGFAVNNKHIGMTCSACHTRQIEVDNISYRIDGGPAFVDFQSFATDLDKAVAAVRSDPKKFEAFAAAVLGGSPSPVAQAQLGKEVDAWYLPYHTIMDIGLPKDKPWGPVRADAVGMIFNRVTGLDIGTGPDHMIPGNIQPATAPVRYPFIWNAPIQDITQWPGFSNNGNDILGLSRNLGEVFGVFAHFHPQKDDWRILGVDYLHTNSANFDGLKTQEKLVKKMGPPQWPWKEGKYAVDQKLAEQGKLIYESKTKTEAGGCAACHGIRKGALRSLHPTWATPLCYVETDVREFDLLLRKVDTGVLAGAQIPFLDKPLQARDELAVSVLGMAVIGSILQHESSLLVKLEEEAQKEWQKIEKRLGSDKAQKAQEHAARLRQMQSKLVNAANADLKGVFQTLADGLKKPAKNAVCKDNFKTAEPAIAYEARVLEGIWAAAPYMHNGSIPTLYDMLNPVAQRPAAFKVGPSFDPARLGLAVEQSKFDYTLQTTDCSDQHSGNSRCGHEFGTKLSPQEKKALLEYLKTL